MNEEEEKIFYEIVGIPFKNETLKKIFCLFENHETLNYKEVAKKLGITQPLASKYLNILCDFGLLRETEKRYGYFELNGKNYTYAISNALSQKAAQLSNKSFDLKLSVEASS